MRYEISAIALVASMSLSLFADDPRQAKARAAAHLELEHLVKERSQPMDADTAQAVAGELLASISHSLPATVEAPLTVARRQAQEEGRPLFLWVGGCHDETRWDFPEGIHLHLASYRGANDKRLVMPREDGDYFWEEKEVSQQAVGLFLRRPKQTRSESPTPAVRRDDGGGGGCSGGQCSPRSGVFRRR